MPESENKAASVSTIEQVAVEVLNECFKLDPKACADLFALRVDCNKELAGHPTVQVQVKRQEKCDVGVIGLLNGIIERASGKRVATIMDGSTLVGFTVYTPPSEN